MKQVHHPMFHEIFLNKMLSKIIGQYDSLIYDQMMDHLNDQLIHQVIHHNHMLVLLKNIHMYVQLIFGEYLKEKFLIEKKILNRI